MEGQHNPWQTETSQGNPYGDDHPQHSQNSSQSQGWSIPNNSSTSHSTGSGNASNNPWQSQTTQNQPPQNHSSQPQYQQPQQQYGGQGAGGYQAPPNPPPRRTDTEIAAILASQPDSGQQIEHMQNYEANKSQTEDERNQAALQKQFPSIDSSLIAAIYSDHKDQRGGQVDLASVRETLQELQS